MADSRYIENRFWP